MRKYDVSATKVINDFNRRKIAPDFIYEVTQGYLRAWRLNQDLIGEVCIGSDKGEIIPGTLRIMCSQYYENTCNPQEIADDIMAVSSLTKLDIEILTPSLMGQKGGAAKTEAKAKAARANGKLGGRPRVEKGEQK